MEDFGFSFYGNNWRSVYVEFVGFDMEYLWDPAKHKWNLVLDIAIPGAEELEVLDCGILRVDGPMLSLNVFNRAGAVRHGTATGWLFSPFTLNWVTDVAEGEIGRPASLRISLDWLSGGEKAASLEPELRGLSADPGYDRAGIASLPQSPEALISGGASTGPLFAGASSGRYGRIRRNVAEPAPFEGSVTPRVRGVKRTRRTEQVSSLPISAQGDDAIIGGGAFDVPVYMRGVGRALAFEFF